MYKHVLLTTDGSELADRSVREGLALAAGIGARVTILTVIEPLHVVGPPEVMIAFPAGDYEKKAEEHAKLVLGRAEEAAEQAGVACTTKWTIHEQPHQAIIDTAADAGCDLIVMGSHGRSGLSKLVLGSVTQKVLSDTKLPVLVIR